jgi:hypothetical protein
VFYKIKPYNSKYYLVPLSCIISAPLDLLLVWQTEFVFRKKKGKQNLYYDSSCEQQQEADYLAPQAGTDDLDKVGTEKYRSTQQQPLGHGTRLSNGAERLPIYAQQPALRPIAGDLNSV